MVFVFFLVMILKQWEKKMKSLAAVMMSVVSMEFSPSLCVCLYLQNCAWYRLLHLVFVPRNPNLNFHNNLKSFGTRMGGKPSAIQRRDHHSEESSFCGVQGGDAKFLQLCS